MITFSKQGSLILLLIYLIASGCKEHISPESVSDYDYFPVETGNKSRFLVHRINYFPSDPPNKSQYQIQTVIGNEFGITQAQNANRIEYYSQWDLADWHADSSGAVWRTTDRAFAQEQGRTIVKMYFPLSEGLSWDGNSFNNEVMQTYRCIDKGKPRQIGSHYFANTVTVVRQQDSTLLSKNKYIEIYAAGIGLVSREKVHVKYCYEPDCSGTIISGYEETAVLQEFNQL